MNIERGDSLLQRTADSLTFPAFAGPSIDDDRIELRALGSALWRRKGLILALTALGAIVAFLLVSQVTPRYSARASVMLDPRSVQVLSVDDVVADATLNNPLLDTEAAVLRSNLLLERVIQSFEPERLAPLDPNNREPGVVLRVRRTLSGALNGLAGRGPAPAVEGAEPLLSDEDRRLRRLVGALRQNMTVWREGQSYLISVGVETTDAELSMLLANAIVREYITSQIRQLSDTVQGATDFLTDRVAETRAEVEQAEAAVEDYRIDRLAGGGISPELLAQQMSELSTQLAVARADQASAEARFGQIQTVIDDSGMAAGAELLSSPFVLSLRERLSELQRERADLSTRLGPDHPDRIRVRAAIDLVEVELADEVRKIVETLRNDVAVARIRADSLQDSLSGMETRAADLSRASLELRQLEREADAVRDSYEVMLGRLNETRSVENLQRADARIVERANIPGAPSAPRVLLFSTLGATVGFGAGIVAVFLLSVTGTGFVRPAQVERATGLPVIATLPVDDWSDVRGMLRAMFAKPYGPFSDRLRQLRATILQRPGGDAVRSILIASSVPGEGKTSLAVALAHSEALANRSCLLLDFDTRQSHLGADLVYDPEGGDLGDLLRGACSIEDAVSRTEGLTFDLLTTRRADPGLADRVSQGQIETLLADLAGRYDLIVIDTPPLLTVSDTLPLVKVADATVLMVRQGKTHRRAVARSARRLTEMGAATAGVVMSMVDPRTESDTYGA